MDLAIRQLQEALQHTSDPATRQRILDRLTQLDTQRSTSAFLAAEEQLRRDRDEHYPYAPTSFYLLLGERPPVDLDAPLRDGVAAALAEPAE